MVMKDQTGEWLAGKAGLGGWLLAGYPLARVSGSSYLY
jgi:hypothetical protein